LHAVIWHAPVEHDAVAFAGVHGTPHPAQFVSELSCVSHPFPVFPSQSPNPPVHAAHPQVPALQLGVPDGQLQTVPHVPQLLTFDSRLVSQPLFGLPSQLPQPAEQVGTHAPDVHVVVPFAFVHVLPHVPQLLGFAPVFVSQPLLALPSQLP
jgi:hypothetical protein